jgi:hypothetical protein
MHKSIASVSLFALLAVSSAQAQPTAITACGQISPGNYVLTKNISASNAMGDCLTIVSPGLVTIDLGGFTITTLASKTGISAPNGRVSAIVRNGTIVATNGISLGGELRSVVEGIRVISVNGLPQVQPPKAGTGISATGVVKDNVVLGGFSVGVAAGGTVTGNYIGPNFGRNPTNGQPVSVSATTGMSVSSGSTVIGNTIDLSASSGNGQVGLEAACPSNVTNNTLTGSAKNIEVGTSGNCNTTNNVAP